jgi:signal peptide peptidase SppA
MNIFQLALTLPWLCTEEYVRLMLDIAAREQADIPLALRLRAEREGRPNALAARQGRPLDGTRDVLLRDGVAIVPVIGPIVRRADFFDSISGATSTATIAQDLNRALDDPAVDAILLEIDSPGGEATGINELARMLFEARGRKPITAYVEGLGASAACWIACAADEIVASATAGLGSIGAVMAVYDPAKMQSKQIEFVSSQSPKKRMDPHTETGKASYQRIVDDLAEVFIGAVATYRGVSEDNVLSDFGQGGILIGRHAVAAGLADRLGSFEETLSGLQQQVRDARRQPARLATTTQGGLMRMDWKGFWDGLLGAAAAAEGEGQEKQLVERTLAPGEKLEAAALPAGSTAREETGELAQLRQQIAQMQERERQASAAAFADGMIRERRAIPAERAELVAFYSQALADDAAQPVASGQTTRVQRLEGLVKARPQHTLTHELVPSGNGGTLPNEGGDDLEQAEESARTYAKQANGRKQS